MILIEVNLKCLLLISLFLLNMLVYFRFLLLEQFSSTVLPFINIKFPVNNLGNPDWDYIYNYMANILDEVSCNFNHLEKYLLIN